MAATKGEALITGLEQIRDGLDMISKLGNRQELLKSIIGSKAAAERLRDVMHSNEVVYNMVLTMVAARNSKLATDTVNKVVTDFLDVLFDLSKPYRDIESPQQENVGE